MSPYAAELLVNEVMPIIQATIPRVVRPVGSENSEELVQDAITQAARMLDSCEHAGKPLIAKSTAFYAIQAMKSGRRSYYAGQADVLCAPLQLKGIVEVADLDTKIKAYDGVIFTLQDVIADSRRGPAEEAAANLDWDDAIEDMNTSDRLILDLAAGLTNLPTVARTLGVSKPRVCQLRQKLAGEIKDRFGDKILVQVAEDPQWRRGNLRANFERQACRNERRVEHAEAVAV